MNTVPRVSVIIIFLNAERFLEEAIASVYAQTYAHWELLLVDDGSTDASAAIARRHAEAQPARVRYLAHPGQVNRGMSATRNLGSRHARGDLIAFLDADDVWFPNVLDEQVAILDAHPEAAMVYGPIQWWYSWTGRPEDRDRDFVEELGVPANRLIRPPRLLRRFLRDQAAVPSGFLVRHAVIDRVGGFEDAFRGEYEDQAFSAKVCLDDAVYAAGRCWYRYRQHPDSCVSIGIASGRTRSARWIYLNWLESYLTARGATDRSVWRALRIELWRYRHPRAFRVLKRGQRLERRVRQRLRVNSVTINGRVA